LSGPVTIGEIREHLAEVHRMEGHRHPEMIDARTATPSFHPSNNVIHFGMARVFSAIAASWVSLSVFDDVETAEAWLEQFRGRES
jgi:hypothetical protein